MQKKILSLIIILFTISVGLEKTADAQSSSEKKEKSELSYRQVTASEDDNANPRITLDLNDVLLKHALKQIADQAKAGIYFNMELLPQKRISLHFDNVPLGEALREVLKGTNLEAFSSARNILLRKKTVIQFSPDTEQEEVEVDAILVKGVVTDSETGETLPGVNIIVKGTNTGTSTDAEGSFQLDVPSLQDTLVVSFVGYQTREVPIDGRTELEIQLTPQAIVGEEMVVVGYGEQQKISTTGSISSVSIGDIDQSPNVSLGNALTGKVPGLTSIQTTGQPGISDPDIFIRGVSSFNNVDPLVVIDGIPSTMEELMKINPSSIEDLSILKDASATAVYGVRGANGVIIATTKRGRSGDIRISANVSAGIQAPSDFIEVTDANGFAQAHNRAARSDGNLSELLPEEMVEAWRTGSDPLIYPNIDWWSKIVNNTAFQTKNNFNVSGGTDIARYFVSLGYLHQDGIFDTEFGGPSKSYNFKYDRFNINANIDINLSSSTQLKLTSKGRIGKRRVPRAQGIGGSFWSQQLVANSVPFGAPGIVDGKFVRTNDDYFPFNVGSTMMQQFYGQGYRDQSQNSFDINLNFTQQLDALVDGLELDAKVNYSSGFTEISTSNAGSFPSYIPVYKKDAPFNGSVEADSNEVVFKKQGGLAPENWGGSYSVNREIYLEASLKYARNFGRHELGGLVLYNQSRDYYPNVSSYPDIPSGYVGSAFRTTYNYDDRYLAEVNIGYNGSENFAKERRFGFFPAFSAGWILTNESFMKGMSFLDHLKFRASWGKVGNDRTGSSRFLYLPDQYTRTSNIFQSYNFGVNIPDFYDGATTAQIGNEEVAWETAIKKNVGIETRFLDNRLTLNFDYFQETREDILMTRNTMPAFLDTPLDPPPVNIGKVRNKGYEIEFGWSDNAGAFAYHLRGNWSYAKNKILNMDEVPPNFPYQRQTGRPLGTNFGYMVEGFYTEENLASGELPDNEMIAEPKPGDLLYKDVNGDGVINNNDRTHIGYPRVPQVNFGTEIGFGYKGFDVNTVWQGVTQVSRRLSGYFQQSRLDRGAVLQWHLDKSWTSERAARGEENLLPRLSLEHNDYNYFTSSSMWVRDASYIRLKNVEIGYTLPTTTVQKIGFRNVRVYLNGYNLLTFTKPEYRTMDPEQDRGSGSNLYPIVKVFNLGLDIDF